MRTAHQLQWSYAVIAGLTALSFIGCGGGDDGGSSPTATHTIAAEATGTRPPSATPTLTPTQSSAGAVSGLLVLQQTVSANRGDALAAPPSGWTDADAESFDRALSFADFKVVGAANTQGVTSADGRFAIADLRAGHYTLSVSKVLDGNLAAFLVPFTVGDDGSADVIAEIALGQVKSISAFTRGGARFMETAAPNGAHVVTRDGQVVEIGDGSRTLTDPDGDGRFAVDGCTVPLSVCEQGQACPNGTLCQCLASCPFCEDCGSPGVCAPAGRVNPYRCSDDGSCKLPGDICRCVPSCPECDDCRVSVCVPICDATEIAGVSIIGGPSQLIVGQQGGFSAVARLSDGSTIDVTYLATWRASDSQIVTIDSWATATAVGLGRAVVTASIGDKISQGWPIQVVARPALRTIHVQNRSCFYPLGLPQTDTGAPPILLPPSAGDILPNPHCTQVVQIGGTIQFQALGEFDDGYYQDITGEVTWQIDPSGVGTVVNGVFTGVAVGLAQLTASLNGVTSEATQLKVVAEPSIVAISIYANNGNFAVVDSRVGADGARPEPCFDCGYVIPVLRGDQLKFQATAQYDTGAWRDVTGEVAWHTSNEAAATIDAQGVMTAVSAGDAAITATLDDVTSNSVTAHVVNEATLQSLSIYQEGYDRVVAKGDQRYFRATGFYDIGISRDVTGEVTWRSSAPTIGDFATPGVFTGLRAGTTSVHAELGGLVSNMFSLEVFETGELAYCDPSVVNRAVWSDEFNRVILESDCDHYDQPGVAALRYTVTEIQPHGGIFDPCLDLYVYRGSQRIRTIREEGCGDPFIPGAAPGRDQQETKYQLRAFWDLKDETGAPVPDGTYQIVGRFYLYYDPVVTLNVIVGSDGGQPGLADLVPTGAFLNAPPLPGGCRPPGGPFPSVTLDVCVANRGDRAAGGFVVDVKNSGEFQVSGLAAGAEKCFSRPYPYYGGEVDVDTTNAVPESNEGNNTGFFSVPVLTPPPTCSPSSGSPTPTPSPYPHGSIPPRWTSTPTPPPYCTPPPCHPGEIYVCPDQCPGGCGTICAPPGPQIFVAPTTLTISCEGRFEIRISNSGNSDGTLVITNLQLSNGYSQGEYGTGFTWDTSQIALPLQLPAGATVMIPVQYREAGFPQSRLEVVIDSNAVNAPHRFVVYHGTGCQTPTPTPIAGCCLPGEFCIPELPPCERCGGLAGIACPAGQVCVDDPSDNCAPPNGADCPGACIYQQSCAGDADCLVIGAPCILCVDGSVACPQSFCEAGFCKYTFETCGTHTPTPTPVIEGVCYRSSTLCGGEGTALSLAACCAFAQGQESPLPVSWCPANHIDPTTRQCHACLEDPCANFPPPTPTPTVDALCPGDGLLLSPRYGLPGDQVQARGRCYLIHSGQGAAIYFDATKVASVTGDTPGNYATEFRVPADAHPGFHEVSLVDTRGVRVQSGIFEVLIGITPTPAMLTHTPTPTAIP